ncbi:MAG: hypothetical protein WA414_08660 [Acidobacteriaceae bacterium]
MSSLPKIAKRTSRPFVLGRKKFAAITAVEGLKLSREGELRLERSEDLAFEERLDEVIRAHSGNRKRA